MWHDSCICLTWLIRMCETTDHAHDFRVRTSRCKVSVIHTHTPLWHDSFICVTRLIHMCDMTHSYEWRDFTYKRDMTHSYVWHDSFMRVKRLIHVCRCMYTTTVCAHVDAKCLRITHTPLWHDSFTRVTWHIHMCHMIWLVNVTRLMHMFDMTHSYLRNNWSCTWLPCAHI